MANPFDQQRSLSGIRHIIAVGSGKGGVGKSTVALNLAMALKQLDLKVGLLDADLYGPSIPSMTGTKKEKMRVHQERLVPISKYGLKLASIGYLVDEHAPVIWRGPMLFKAIEQFLGEVDWGDLDYLVVDLPPGTGDVVLTLAQKTPVSGGIVVCTPQNLALADAVRAVAMFKEIQIPLLGIVENMAYFKQNEQSSAIQLFPKGQLDSYLKENGIEKLAEVPFHPDIGLFSESGVPLMEQGLEEGKCFAELAQKIHLKLKKPAT
ncbi:MAG: Mrp/NBP35 family ATP-binding protein [Bdellovibrionales bacterium]|nr:Mrp/NBP35 family ATP-binding protein [Bdellovibrionales bacterium]